MQVPAAVSRSCVANRVRQQVAKHAHVKRPDSHRTCGERAGMPADAWAAGITNVLDPEVKVAGLSWVAGLQGTCCTCRISGCSTSRGKGTCPVHLCAALAHAALACPTAAAAPPKTCRPTRQPASRWGQATWRQRPTCPRPRSLDRWQDTINR